MRKPDRSFDWPFNQNNLLLGVPKSHMVTMTVIEIESI